MEKLNKMRAAIIRLGPLKYMPILQDNYGKVLKYSKLSHCWMNTFYPKTFKTRRGAEQFIKDFVY